MDLFEYQAKELFAEYGVPVQAGKVASTPEQARDIAAEFAAQGHPLVVVKAQVKTGGRGKAGGVKLAEGPEEAYAKAAQILGMDIKGHTVHTVLIAQAVDIEAEYYLSFLLDRANRTFLSICTVQGGMEIEEVAHSTPGAVARVPVSPLTGVDAGKAKEIIAAGRIPAAGGRGCRAAGRTAVGHVHRRGRHAGRGQPDGADLRWPRARGRRQGDAGRQRLVPPGARPVRRRQQHRPARGPGPGQAPQLRQARWPGRHHRQRGGPGHVHPGRGGLRRGRVRRHQARQLPGHRRRRLRRGHGQRPGDRAVRPECAGRVRERLRRDHVLRRGGQRDRLGHRHAEPSAGITWTGPSWSGWTGTTPPRAGASWTRPP